jgi:hypothetical protein
VAVNLTAPTVHQLDINLVSGTVDYTGIDIRSSTPGARLVSLGSSGVKAQSIAQIPASSIIPQMQSIQPDLYILTFATNENAANIQPGMGTPASTLTTFNGTSITATCSGSTITPTGYSVVASDLGTVLTITGGTNFNAGTFFIASESSGWVVTDNTGGANTPCTGAGSAMTGSISSGLAGNFQEMIQRVSIANPNVDVMFLAPGAVLANGTYTNYQYEVAQHQLAETSACAPAGGCAFMAISQLLGTYAQAFSYGAMLNTAHPNGTTGTHIASAVVAFLTYGDQVPYVPMHAYSDQRGNLAMGPPTVNGAGLPYSMAGLNTTIYGISAGSAYITYSDLGGTLAGNPNNNLGLTFNVYRGYRAGYTSQGSQNVGVGAYACSGNTTTGNTNNSCIGEGAGSGSTGTYNVLAGFNAGTNNGSGGVTCANCVLVGGNAGTAIFAGGVTVNLTTDQNMNLIGAYTGKYTGVGILSNAGCIGYACGVRYSNSFVTGRLTNVEMDANYRADPVLPKTAAYSLNYDESGAVTHNNGASGTVIYTLPSCNSTTVGTSYYAYGATATASAFTLEWLATTPDTISLGPVTGASAGNIQTVTFGSSAKLTCIAANKWAALNPTGNWTVN